MTEVILSGGYQLPIIRLMHTKKAIWLGSFVLATATLTWAQAPGQQGPKGNAFAPVQTQRAHIAPAMETDPDRQRPASDTAYLDSDYRHHSLDDDAERAHERRQHHRQAAVQPAAAGESPSSTTLADAH